jgi:hypothetical protein
MVSRTIGFTPFKILYGEEAMLPEEIKHQSLHTIRHAMAEDEEYSKETIESTRLEALKLRHSLRDISKIEYEHYSTSDSGHKKTLDLASKQREGNKNRRRHSSTLERT